MTAPDRHHVVFSPARIAAIASNTLLELVRLKVFYFLIIFGLFGVGAAFFAATLKMQEQFQVIKDVALGAMSIFTWLLATLATAMMLPKDVEDRTLYTILAKPVPRFEYLLGKLAGVLLMLLVALGLMSIAFVGVMYWREHQAIAETLAQYPPSLERTAELKSIQDAAFNINLIPGVMAIYMKAAVVAAVTLLISTFASSQIFTVLVSMAVYFIGNVQPIARDYWIERSGVSATPLVKGFFLFVTLVFPDFQIFDLVDDILVGTPVSTVLFAKTMGFGCGYILIYTLVGYLLFAEKEL